MKKAVTKTKKAPFDVRTIKSGWYLLAGVLTMTFAHMSFSLDIAGWFSTVPFLIYLYITRGWKSRVFFTLALIVGWFVVVLKIISPPIPAIFALFYSVPIALMQLPAYLFWNRFKNYK